MDQKTQEMEQKIREEKDKEMNRCHALMRETKKRAVEVTDETLTKELASKITFLHYATLGAMGEPGGVLFLTEDGGIYHAIMIRSACPQIRFFLCVPSFRRRRL